MPPSPAAVKPSPLRNLGDWTKDAKLRPVKRNGATFAISPGAGFATPAAIRADSMTFACGMQPVPALV